MLRGVEFVSYCQLSNYLQRVSDRLPSTYLSITTYLHLLTSSKYFQTIYTNSVVERFKRLSLGCASNHKASAQKSIPPSHSIYLPPSPNFTCEKKSGSDKGTKTPPWLIIG
ncbi:MAG: hypothetical protein SWX82_02305 [Cyanobacteriota bacterium]|nr:hypothetical protein [Cyanobacteriota bacterium]